MQPEAFTRWNVGDVILDLYKVTDILGEGGFGTVYKVRHQGWNIHLAVKSPKPEVVAATGGVENFEREAETWVNLGLHPHTVSCYYVRRIESSPLVFAEYVAGGSLQDWIGDRRLYVGGTAASLKRILDIAIQFAWGLHYAHEQGLVHQDVKPANVMLTPEGGVKMTDFGLAKGRTLADRLDFSLFEKGEGEAYTLMTEGSGTMTPAYCSPEQAKRQTLTRRSDLWSWGLCVLEMFQGGRNWQAGIIAAQALEFYWKIWQKGSQLPQMPVRVALLLQRCFRDNPDERPRNMLAVVNELQWIYQEVTKKAYPRQEPRAGKDTADTLNNRAVSLLDLGKQEEALQLWKQALQMHPQHPESTYNRSLILWRTHRSKRNDDTLVKDMEKMGKSHRGDWFADYLLGLVHLERNDCKAAIKILQAMQGANAEQRQVKAALLLEIKRSPSWNRCLRTFKGHTDSVNSVCLSADCRFALSGSVDHTLKLWEVKTGRCLRTFEGHTSWVNSVCLSADGRFALSGSADSTLKLWEVSTGRCLRTFEGYRLNVNSVCLSADCRFALSGGFDGTLKLWEVATGRCLRIFEGHRLEVNSVCLSTDGRFALSGSFDKTLKLWEVATGLCLRTFKGHTSSVKSVSLSTDCRFALSMGRGDQTPKLWEVATGRCMRTFEGRTSWVNSVCLSADGRFALSGSADNTLKLWAVSTGRCLRTFEGHKGWVNSVCLSADGRFGLSGSSDHSMKLWAVNGIETKPYQAPIILSQVLATETFLSLSLTYEQELEQARVAQRRGNYVAAAQHIRKARSQSGYSHSAEAVNAWTSLYVHLPRKAFKGSWESATLAEHTESVNSVYLSADSRFALSGSGYHTLKLWEVATGRCLRTFEEYLVSEGETLVTFLESLEFDEHINQMPIFEVQRRGVNSVCLSADSRFALSGSSDFTLKLWEVATGQCLRAFEGHTNEVASVCFSADSYFALSGSDDKTLKLWEVATGRCLRTFEGHTDMVYSVCLSTDSRLALSGSLDNTLKLWQVTTGRCLRTFEGHQSPVYSVCLSADSRLALSGSFDNTLKLWEVTTGRCIRIFKGHTGAVSSVCLSADSRYALSGSGDSTLKLWEVATGRCLHTFVGHKGWVYSVCLSADSRYALSGSGDSTLKLWVLDWELEERQRTDWDEGARPYLKNFLTLHTPYAATLPEDREPSEQEITLALTRRGTPTWTKEDFQKLLYTLGCAGYGWLRPEGVRKQLEAMAKN